MPKPYRTTGWPHVAAKGAISIGALNSLLEHGLPQSLTTDHRAKTKIRQLKDKHGLTWRSASVLSQHDWILPYLTRLKSHGNIKVSLAPCPGSATINLKATVLRGPHKHDFFTLCLAHDDLMLQEGPKSAFLNQVVIKLRSVKRNPRGQPGAKAVPLLL